MVSQKPQWWQIYLLGLMIVGLLLLEHFAFTEITTRHIMQIGVVLVGYRLILAWLGSQARAIEREDQAYYDAVAHDHDLPITK